MEMIFIDEQGDTVQASIKYTLLYRFQSKIKVNRCYVISNLSAFFSVKTYKHALNDYRVTFEYTSTVREVGVPSIPMYSFKFTFYADIQQASNNNEYTIDVIGSLLSIGSLNQLSGGTKQNIPFELEDIDGSKVNCLLWGKFAEYILQRIQDIGVGPYIVVIQFATTEIKNGEVQVSNHWHSSRVLINEDIPAINEFKSSLIRSKPNSGQVISQKSSQSSYSMEDDFIRKTVRKKLDELSDTNEVITILANMLYWPLLRVLRKHQSGGTMVALSVIDLLDRIQMWYCHVCKAHWPTAKPTYKVEVIFMDDTNSASMIGEEPVEYPMELEGLIDRRMLFKIAIKGDNVANEDHKTYNIQKVCTDDAIIASFLKHYEMDAKHDNGSSSLSFNYDNDGCVFSSKVDNLFLINCSYVARTCSNFIDGVVDGDITTNAIVDDDVNAITPMKRSNDSILDSILNDPTVQQSSTKLLKNIKQEKME
ncbi:PREDICTED: uncharacterized protein LOC105967827 [Erythranthe guttata]|uniref:uncharacterized protein LOC105967827 n=1 Tax=Erythranthe guttata TaxID=4155 RepID=UPI00064DEF5E|nr:PREDICTED: uncharacterized protein LOC105967827 [Erythranthe guttata]|eukprot:XP_012847883.1 PREDICTED: uncharacterized protein LOC105967827 [Erythranthe guttata]